MRRLKGLLAAEGVDTSSVLEKAYMLPIPSPTYLVYSSMYLHMPKRARPERESVTRSRPHSYQGAHVHMCMCMHMHMHMHIHAHVVHVMYVHVHVRVHV